MRRLQRLYRTNHPLDSNVSRFYCQGVAPADAFDPNNVVYNLDRIVQETGAENASNAHPIETGRRPSVLARSRLTWQARSVARCS